MKEAALLSLSSRSVLLSIMEECTPSSIPYYTPSVTVQASVCVCARVQDVIGLARPEEYGDQREPKTWSHHHSQSWSVYNV